MYRFIIAYTAAIFTCIGYCSWFTANHLGLPTVGLVFALAKIWNGWHLLLLLQVVVNGALWVICAPGFISRSELPFTPWKLHVMFTVGIFFVVVFVCSLNATTSVGMLLH